jgi:4a-hydroxytetrahydrobiopterin dehydratase
MSPKTQLRTEHCIPCSTGDKLGLAERRRLIKEVPAWRFEGDRIARDLVFKDFKSALQFANAIGRVAEREDHHPDLHLTGYKNLRVDLTTHAAEGLTRNDFILADKIDALLAKPGWRPKLRPQRRPRARGRALEETISYPIPPF